MHGADRAAGSGVLSDTQRASFAESGYCVIHGAFDRADAKRMATTLLSYLAEHVGVRLDDPSTWCDLRGGAPFAALAKQSAFSSVGTQRLSEALDDLVGAGEWTDSRGWRAPLVTLPGPDGATWDVPRSWHTDAPVWPTAQIVRMFAYLADVPPRGGGTLVVAGSHRVAVAWAERHPDSSHSSAEFKKSLRRECPWFGELFGRQLAWGSRAKRFMEETGESFGVPVRVHELSGHAGDVVLWHPSLLHAESPNILDVPRLMLTHTVELGRRPPCP